MTKINKDIQRFLERPASLRYAQIQKILLYLGFEKIDAKGSHIKFKHPALDHDLIIPLHDNDCKDFYKKLASKIIRDHHLIK